MFIVIATEQNSALFLLTLTISPDTSSMLVITKVNFRCVGNWEFLVKVWVNADRGEGAIEA